MTDTGKISYLYRQKQKGAVYYYYRRGSVLLPIEGEFRSPEFMANYYFIHASYEAAPITEGVIPNSVNDGAVRFYGSGEYDNLAPTTRDIYRGAIERLREKNGNKPLKGLTYAALSKMRDQLKETPTTANIWVRSISAWLSYCHNLGMIPENPLLDAHGRNKLKPLKNTKHAKTKGWAPWPEASLERGHDLFTDSPRIAFYLALYTGQRKGDVLAMRWDHIGEDGFISVAQEKTDKRLRIPMDKRLAAELTKIPRKGVAIVARRDGRPYTESGFNRIWRRQQTKHGFKGLQFHGLRKNAVNALLEAGCEIAEVAAVTGQSHRTVEYYAALVNQKLLAQRAVNKRETAYEQRVVNFSK